MKTNLPAKCHPLIPLIISASYFVISLIYYPVILLINKIFGKEIITCIFMNKFHIPCPTCGGSRAAYYFAKFNFAEAFIYNKGTFFLSVFFVIELLSSLFFLVQKKEYIIPTKRIKYYIIIFLIIIFLSWIIEIFF